MHAALSGSEEDGICRRGRWLAASPRPAPARAAEVFKKYIASKGRCVATVAVSVSDRGLNDIII